MPNQTIRRLLADSDTFATTLLVIAVDVYGLDAVAGSGQWAPETLISELQEDFDIEIPRVNQDKLMAAINLVTSDDFYQRPAKFVQLCNVLAGSELDDSIDLADAMECAWGLTEAVLISPPEDLENPFNPEIYYYLGRVLDAEGIKEPPDLLRLAIRDTESGGADYSDMDVEDPEMFAAEYSVQANKSKEISDMLEEQLLELFQQLQQLPLRTGNTKELLSRVGGRVLAAAGDD